MTLRERYRKLTLWSKLGLWGSLASVVGLPLAILPLLQKPGHEEPPLRSEDFLLRLCVVGYGLTSKDLSAAQQAIHVRGRLGATSVESDLRLVQTLIYGSTRGRAMPEICYQSEQFMLFNLSLLNQRGIYGNRLQISMPESFRELAERNSKCDANLFVRGHWYPQGMRPCNEGTDIEISPPR
jgi:hypothetical protein